MAADGSTPLRRKSRRASPTRHIVLLLALVLPSSPLRFSFAQHSAPTAAQQATPQPETLTPAAARDRIQQLRTEIAHHNELYFRQAAPEISDFEYDQLKIELQHLEQSYPEIAGSLPQVPAQDDDRTGRFPVFRHRVPMLSLDKTYNEEDLRAFDQRVATELGRRPVDYVVEPKIDGLAVSVVFDHGRLVHAATRGNGRKGDDITANVLTIETLPHALRATAPDGSKNPIPEVIEVRGELYMTFAEFDRLNRERQVDDEPPFAHPRNLATGTAKLTDPEEVAKRKLSIVFYGWGACEPLASMPKSQHAFTKQLRAWGLPSLETSWRVRGADAMVASIQEFAHARGKLGYPADGAVVKVDDVMAQQHLGLGPDAPKWAIAFKYPPDRLTTRVLGITIQIGRTGRLTPVAELAPIEIAGSTVSRASLHNRATIARLGVRVNDFVYVEKAGEIIPQITGVDLTRRPQDSYPFEFPTSCPDCGTGLVNSGDDGAIHCPNAHCPTQVRLRIAFFASPGCVGITGLGEATVAQLVDHGWVDNVADLYHLHRADLLTLGDDVTQSTENLLTAVEASKEADLWRVVLGLGIRHVGTATAKRLAQAFGSLSSLAKARRADFDALASSGSTPLSESIVASLSEYFNDPENAAMVADLVAAEVGQAPKSTAAASTASSPRPLDGKVFVLTGRLPTLTRAEATKRIEAAGGKVSSHVSHKTDYILVGEHPGTKLERAREFGVPTLDEAALLRLLNAN